MAVCVFWVIGVFKPFLELAQATDLVWRNAFAFGNEDFAKLGVEAQGAAGIDAVGEEVANDLVVHCGACDEAAIFG